MWQCGRVWICVGQRWQCGVGPESEMWGILSYHRIHTYIVLSHYSMHIYISLLRDILYEMYDGYAFDIDSYWGLLRPSFILLKCIYPFLFISIYRYRWCRWTDLRSIEDVFTFSLELYISFVSFVSEMYDIVVRCWSRNTPYLLLACVLGFQHQMRTLWLYSRLG
jgi:hypothetical protein